MISSACAALLLSAAIAADPHAAHPFDPAAIWAADHSQHGGAAYTHQTLDLDGSEPLEHILTVEHRGDGDSVRVSGGIYQWRDAHWEQVAPISLEASSGAAALVRPVDLDGDGVQELLLADEADSFGWAAHPSRHRFFDLPPGKARSEQQDRRLASSCERIDI